MLERILFISINLRLVFTVRKLYVCICYISIKPTLPYSSLQFFPHPLHHFRSQLHVLFLFFLTHWVRSVLPVCAWVWAYLLEHFAKSWSCFFHWHIDHQKMRWSQSVHCVWHRKKKRWKDFLSSLLPILKCPTVMKSSRYSCKKIINKKIRYFCWDCGPEFRLLAWVQSLAPHDGRKEQTPTGCSPTLVTFMHLHT